MPDANVEAMNQAYLAYLPILTRMVRRILHWRPDDVEDILHDVWIKAAVNANGLRDIRTVRTWLGRIAMNEALNLVRKTKRQGYAEPLSEIELPSHAPPQDELFLFNEAYKALYILGQDAPKQAAAVLLVYLAGYTYTEAAAKLGTSEGTVKSNAHKAIRKLSDSLTLPKAA